MSEQISSKRCCRVRIPAVVALTKEWTWMSVLTVCPASCLSVDALANDLAEGSGMNSPVQLMYVTVSTLAEALFIAVFVVVLEREIVELPAVSACGGPRPRAPRRVTARTEQHVAQGQQDRLFRGGQRRMRKNIANAEREKCRRHVHNDGNGADCLCKCSIAGREQAVPG